MPTIRITDETLKDLERVASEFRDLKRPGYESIFKITPDIVIRQLIQDWDTTEKEDLALTETRIEKQIREEQKKEDKT